MKTRALAACGKVRARYHNQVRKKTSYRDEYLCKACVKRSKIP
jgi:hypothetical protein